MLRVLYFVFVVALATLAALWLVDLPGAVTIDGPDYQLTTSLSVLIVAVAAIAVVWALVYHVWRWLRGGPRRIAAGWSARRHDRGYQALTKGLVAIAAGDAKAAQRFGRDSGRLLDNPLNLLVLAQSARLTGDETGARRHFQAMLVHPETEFLGLRGLLVQATNAGDWEAALGYARRAYALRPETEWVGNALFDLQARAGDWRAAQKTLEAAVRRKHVAAGHAPRRRAVLLAERARAAYGDGEEAAALGLAREAHKLAPSLTAAAALAAGLLAKTGKKRAAAKVIEAAWRLAPHGELAAAYAALGAGESALERVKRLERLHALNADHPESHLALAQAALDAELWGAARNHLLAAADRQPSQCVYRLLATAEERDSGSAEAVRNWLMSAASAPPDPAWLCDKCGDAAAEWSARCEACGAFDSLGWKLPPTPAHLSAAPVTTPLPRADDAPLPSASIAPPGAVDDIATRE